ncbi:hypothetical protein FRC05_009934 [Tulasnella sp. 425]|nr:hypothetical protein FRC05_009934 [Tulasnella sp. 425]
MRQASVAGRGGSVKFHKIVDRKQRNIQTASKDVHVPTPHPLENAKLDGTSSGRAADAPNSQPGLEDARTSTGGLPNRTLFCQSSQNLLPRQQIPTSTAERFHHTALEDEKRGILAWMMMQGGEESVVLRVVFAIRPS